MDQEGGKVVAHESLVDGYFAEFRNMERQLVKVHVSADQLRQFDNGNLEDVLRAILKTYLEKIGNPPSDIHAGDLGSYLYPLQVQFRQG